MIIDCIADLHGHYPELEGGNLLIVAGDLTARDTQIEHREFFEWLDAQNYQEKVFIAGNHDNYFQKNEAKTYTCPLGIVYLEDQSAEYEYEYPSATEYGSREGPLGEISYEKKKIKIWGSPWTLKFDGMNPKCMAFTCDTEKELAEKWALIPDDIDILVTHGPPYQIRDGEGPWQHLGSSSLIDRILNLSNLKIHAFGHIHEGYGFSDRGNHQLKKESEDARFINCSHVNERYEPVNKPIRVIL